MSAERQVAAGLKSEWGWVAHGSLLAFKPRSVLFKGVIERDQSEDLLREMGCGVMDRTCSDDCPFLSCGLGCLRCRILICKLRMDSFSLAVELEPGLAWPEECLCGWHFPSSVN